MRPEHYISALSVPTKAPFLRTVSATTWRINKIRALLASEFLKNNNSYYTDHSLSPICMVDFFLYDQCQGVKIMLGYGAKTIYATAQRIACCSRVSSVVLITDRKMEVPDHIMSKPLFICTVI